MRKEAPIAACLGRAKRRCYNFFMSFEPIDLSELSKEREEELAKIYRYDLFKTMFYRPNLFEHGYRVMWLVEDLLRVVPNYIDIDPIKARVMAFVHDDAEVIVTDIASSRKKQMTKTEKEAFLRAEEDASREIGKRFGPTIAGYDYTELLLEAMQKNTPEAQLVEFADKTEAYNETMHEIFAGNFTFIFPLCHTVRSISTIVDNLSHLQDPAKKSEHPFFGRDIYAPMEGKFLITKDKGGPTMQPHTKESIRETLEYFPHHDHWRKVMLERGGERAEKWLTEQREVF